MIEEVASLRNLWSSAKRAARGKRHRRAVAATLLELEGTVLALRRQLLDGSYRPGRPAFHTVHDPKRRLIAAAPFLDRIVHQALSAVLGPPLESHLIHHTYACRVGRGTHAALDVATRWARARRYVAHLDVRQYFPSVDHALLLEQLRRHLPCAHTLALCARILEAGAEGERAPRWHFPGDDLLTPLGRRVGLPIGNLTSQHFANRYLSPVDHRATDRLRVRGYLRYMDDMLLFGDDRAGLEAQARAVEEACWRLRLRLHPWQVRPTREGVNFLGFRVLPDVVRVRRTSVARAERRLAALADEVARGAPHDPLTASLRSTFAHWRRADTYRLRERTLRKLGLLYDPAEPDSWRERLDGEREDGEPPEDG